MLPIDQVIGSHNRTGVCSLDRNLKAPEVDLASSPLTDMRVDMISIILLIVKGKMLDRRACALMFLHAQGIGRSAFPGDQRVL